MNANGIAVGEFEGEDEAAAVEAFAREAGYESFESLKVALGEIPGEKPWLGVEAIRI